MHLKTRIAVLLGALTLVLAPSAALAHEVEYEVEGPPKTKPLPGPGASAAKKSKAYGAYCSRAGFARKHVAGTPGTPFSQCVTAMARAATVRDITPGRACQGFSKTHVAGQAGTPYSQCVAAAAKVKRQLRS